MLFKRKQANYSIMADMVTSKDRLAEESKIDKKAHKRALEIIKKRQKARQKLWQSQVKEEAKAYRLVIEQCLETKCSY